MLIATAFQLGISYLALADDGLLVSCKKCVLMSFLMALFVVSSGFAGLRGLGHNYFESKYGQNQFIR